MPNTQRIAEAWRSIIELIHQNRLHVLGGHLGKLGLSHGVLSPPLTKQGAKRLSPLLEMLAEQQRVAERLAFDPLEFPRRYRHDADIEVVGLIAASMAYGRASVFKPCIERVLDAMGPNPAQFARLFSVTPDVRAFRAVHYRFNQPADFAALVAGIGWCLNEHGGLGERFGTLFGEFGLREALARFADELRQAPPVGRILTERGSRGLSYLLSDARGPGAAKRWHLYLRWMIRGPDAADLGIWRNFAPKAALLVPLDTHIARIANHLRLTDRVDLSWRTSEEITASLRRIDPSDPVRFDFSLCHHGMSGDCPVRQARQSCEQCPLRTACRGRVRV